MSNMNGNAPSARNRNWFGGPGDPEGCMGCGPAWWAIGAIILFVLFFWGWGFPGWGGWGGWGWRHAGYGGGASTTTNTSARVPSGNGSEYAPTGPAHAGAGDTAATPTRGDGNAGRDAGP